MLLDSDKVGSAIQYFQPHLFHTINQVGAPLATEPADAAGMQHPRGARDRKSNKGTYMWEVFATLFLPDARTLSQTLYQCDSLYVFGASCKLLDNIAAIGYESETTNVQQGASVPRQVV